MIYRSISNLNVWSLLQLDINAVVNWCGFNNLQCQAFMFYRTYTVIHFNYEIKSILLTRPNSIKDLSVILDRKLLFRIMFMFLFLNLWRCLVFKEKFIWVFWPLYTSMFVLLVAPHLEYCGIIWNPVYNSHYLRIEGVQKNFTRYVF